MLVLTRRVGESIVIGNNITVNIVQMHGEQVQVGISAPSDIPVYRLELYKQVSNENVKAATNQTDLDKGLGLNSESSQEGESKSGDQS